VAAGALVIVLALLGAMNGCSSIKTHQQPQPPFPYLVKEVAFQNVQDNAVLNGTLSLPKGKGRYPAVVLLSGSGPFNRNEEMFGHKPFMVLSDHLTRSGFAVLRYDKRNYDSPREEFYQCTTEDFSKDAVAATEFLKRQEQIDVLRIGLLGHSEGGLVAAMVASKDSGVAFVILMAGPGLPGDQVLLGQARAEYASTGVTGESLSRNMGFLRDLYAILKKSNDAEEVKNELERTYSRYSEGTDTFTRSEFEALRRKVLLPWFRFLVSYDPSVDLQNVRCPLLALNGELDMQVLPEENLAAIGNALRKGKNADFKTVEMPGLNHLFQKAKTGKMDEYSRIKETIAPQALSTIKNWLLERVAN
jgi:hypothetical protein